MTRWWLLRYMETYEIQNRGIHPLYHRNQFSTNRYLVNHGVERTPVATTGS